MTVINGIEIDNINYRVNDTKSSTMNQLKTN